MIKTLVHSALFALLISLAGASYGQVPQIEREALVALYNSTDGANWKDNTGWLGEAGTECDWFGVTCSSEVVTRLIFPYNSLTGTIPTELGNLTSLTFLDLSRNSLTGSIPSELGDLESLTILDLGLNSLSGTIPTEFGNLSNLTYLSLSYNSLSGAIPSEVTDLPNLETTGFAGNLFVGPGFTITEKERDALIALYKSTDGANWKDNTGWLGEVGTECDWFGVVCLSGTVTQLILYSNSLNGSIPKEIGNLTGLTMLNLSNNTLSGIIPSEIGNLASLANLNLGANSLSGNIPTELGNLSNLYTLFLSTRSAYTSPIPPSLKNLSNSSGQYNTDIHRLLVLGIDDDNDGISDSLDNHLMEKAEYEVVKKSGNSIVFSRNNRVVNVISSAWFDELTRTDRYPFTGELGKLIYEVFEDQFDILMLTPNSLGNGKNFAVRFKSDSITGIGKSSTAPSSGWGSKQKLMGSIYFQNPNQIKIGPGLHEIAHIWATPDMFLYNGASGHAGNSNLGGLLGGWKPNTLEYLEDGNYKIETVRPNIIAPSGWSHNFMPYGNFELYLMGLFSPDEVGHDLIQANDLQWINTSEGIFSASSITTTSMEEFIEQNGPRVPNYRDSQKHFDALFVVVSKEPLTLDEWNLYDSNLAEFEATEDDGFKHRYNFWEATYGRASISFNRGDHLLASSLPEKYVLTNVDKKISGLSTGVFPVEISYGDRTIVDSDNAAGELVNLAAVVVTNKNIATTQWLVDGVKVAAGLSASVPLPNGSTVVTFKATDDDGGSSTTTTTITVEAPAYTATEEWPAPYNGVTPDTYYGLAFNNIGIFNSSDATIYACLRLFTNGLASSSNGISQFDIGLKVVSVGDATVQITKSREFNATGALSENVQAPDCSGIFETTTSLYTDIIQVNSSVLETVWSLIDPTNLILKLVSSKELAANSQSPQIQRDALIALYNSTDGSNWKDNTGWLGEVGTECDWFGVSCSLGSVYKLYLYNNSLTGSIPPELGNLKSLETLQLGGNSLSGAIPIQLSYLKNLEMLYLGLNSLNGSIPPELGSLSNLTYLNLQNNSLSGSIPSELGNLKKLTALYLGTNSLSGTIPKELGNLINLTKLYLNDNSLSGDIPAELSNLTKLETFKTSGNSL